MEQWEYLAIVGVTRDQVWLVVDNARWLHQFTENVVTAVLSIQLL